MRQCRCHPVRIFGTQKTLVSTAPNQPANSVPYVCDSFFFFLFFFFFGANIISFMIRTIFGVITLFSFAPLHNRIGYSVSSRLELT
jgi:hypothetical protein